MSYPENLKYTKEHEWVLVNGDSGTIGITDHAQHELGDIVFVDLPRLGAQLKRGETLGSVESVKAVSDIAVGVGLGVRSREQAAEIGSYADGVIVGSALVSALTDGLPALQALTEELAAGVRQRVSGVSG